MSHARKCQKARRAGRRQPRGRGPACGQKEGDCPYCDYTNDLHLQVPVILDASGMLTNSLTGL